MIGGLRLADCVRLIWRLLVGGLKLERDVDRLKIELLSNGLPLLGKKIGLLLFKFASGGLIFEEAKVLMKFGLIEGWLMVETKFDLFRVSCLELKLMG